MGAVVSIGQERVSIVNLWIQFRTLVTVIASPESCKELNF
jgi:hypothetical protein